MAKVVWYLVAKTAVGGSCVVLARSTNRELVIAKRQELCTLRGADGQRVYSDMWFSHRVSEVQ